MYRKSITRSLCGALAFAAMAPLAVFAQAPPIPPQEGAERIGAPADQQGIQVLEQGPVHEAFAEPVVLEAAKRIVVDRAPPDLVNELPPEVRPEGNNIQWI